MTKTKVIFIVLVCSLVIFGQQIQEKDKEQIKVLSAVAPTFFPFVYNKTGVAEVVIEVKINNEGKVTSTKTVFFTHFTDLSIDDVARQWIFEKSTDQNERTAKIRFVFRVMPKEAEAQDLTTIYRYPSEIEVRSRIIDSPKTSFPLPDKEKPSKKKTKM
jgi:hypothetical protein